MENQYYKLQLTGSMALEISVFDTDEIGPYRKELGITVLGKDMHIDACMDLAELDSLIRYLNSCQDYINKCNANSGPLNSTPT